MHFAVNANFEDFSLRDASGGNTMGCRHKGVIFAEEPFTSTRNSQGTHKELE
jgi:hypothetical protein